MTEHFYGETIQLGNTFTDLSGDKYDPDTISLAIYDAEGTLDETVTYAADEIKKTSTGIFYYNYTIDAESTSQGYWVGVWTIEVGTAIDKSEEQFYVRSSAEKLYVSVSDVKNSLMTSGVTMADDTIRNSIRTSMAECDLITGRKFTNENTKTEWFNTNQANPNTTVNQLFLSYLPVQSVTTLKTYNTSKELVKTYADTEYWVDDNGIVELCTGEFVHQRYRVECVYEYGYTAVPTKISKLCSVIAQIEVMREYMISQDDKITGFSMPEIAQVQLGETYMTAQLAIKELEDQKKILISEIGSLRNDVYII